MAKKSDERARRRAEKLEKFEASKKAIVSNLILDNNPRVARDPISAAEPRVAPHLARALAESGKSAKIAADSRWNQQVTWCVTRKDVDGRWSWGEERRWSEAEWNEVIAPAFTAFEQLNWGQIDALASGSGHKMHHSHELSDLIEEAQERWRSLQLEEFDSVFRFRLGSTRRVWGFIVQAHFHFVWWERNHRIYPVG